MSDNKSSNRPPKVLGSVEALWRYPVKSMAGEQIDSIDVGWHGFAGDRRWGFVRADRQGVGFPWLTLRENPELALYLPRIIDSTRPNAVTPTVATPQGETVSVLDPELAERLSPGARVMKLSRGVFDAMPISLVTKQALSVIGAAIGHDLDPRRFRPNIVVSAVEEGGFPEDSWIGRIIRIGTAEVRIDRQNERCAVINVDPALGQVKSRILQSLPRDRYACLGVYGSVVTPGWMRSGDPLEMLD